MGAAPSRQAQLSPRPEATARAYAQCLLDSLNIAPPQALDIPDEHPAIAWARSGLMSLTGQADGAPRMCPVPLAACADGALAALASFATAGKFADLRGSQLLTERAAITGFTRNGRISPGGSCRLLEASDCGIAVNLARPEDWELIPAWLECESQSEWAAVERIVRQKPADELLERARLLGLAVALDEMPDLAPVSWFRAMSRPLPNPPPHAGEGRGGGGPLVVDLSSLWAGPLCSHLLLRLGARVIKVESPLRPDGARQGPALFYHLLNAGKQSVVMDAHIPRSRDRLRALLAKADIVIEGSRPRALRQLGIVAEDLVTENPGLTWISITGHGRGEPQENWIAYGDDAGVAAGLSSLMAQATGERMIVGDAIGDPLTGLHAALAAWAGWLGDGGLFSLSLRDVVGHCVHFDLPPTAQALRSRQAKWTRQLVDAGISAARPALRNPGEWARALGADTESVLSAVDNAA